MALCNVKQSQKDAASQSQEESQFQWESGSSSERGEGVIKKRIVDGHADFGDKIWAEVTQEGRDLVTMLLVYGHLERATVYGALRSAWIVRKKVSATRF